MIPPMFSLKDKVAVVTGAGRGIGLAIARTFAEAGADFPNSAIPYAVDVANSDAVTAMAKQVIADFGTVDILVNNAGLTRDGLVMRMSNDDWDAVLNTNLKGAFHTVKAFQRTLLRQKDARIINVASIIGLIGNAGQANYAASKAGLIGFTKSIAREFASRGVTANAIAPGFISTDMTSVLSDEIRSAVLQKIPLGFLGEVNDIAAAALYLASPAARFVTGQVLTVDGGMVM
jgi:3-oxoacyl-[acyl-carrier protein] reductase